MSNLKFYAATFYVSHHSLWNHLDYSDSVLVSLLNAENIISLLIIIYSKYVGKKLKNILEETLKDYLY